MGEWLIGASINIFGSVIINYGTNLLKLGHDERKRYSLLGSDGINGKAVLKPIFHFQIWRIGIIFFAFGNCLNFISFGYAAQSLLAALGSIQFLSNLAFAYFILKKTVTVKLMFATAFIVVGNIFLVIFGNHQSPVYTAEQLAEKFSNIAFLRYCLILILIVAMHQSIYRRGELAVHRNDRSYWVILLPLSYAIVSAAIGSCSVLFAKSLSNLLRLSMSSGYEWHSWFTYSMILLFLSTAGFWMTRLNRGLSLFDAIIIVPMFQIAWTFFSICTGIVYFQEYQVFNMLRTTMFILGMISVFIGIFLLAPDEPKGGEVKDIPLVSVTTSSESNDVKRLDISIEGSRIKDVQSFVRAMQIKAADVVAKAKTTHSLTFGLEGDSIHAPSFFTMSMVSSNKMNGFRGNDFGQAKFFSWSGFGTGSNISPEEDGADMLETASMLPRS